MQYDTIIIMSEFLYARSPEALPSEVQEYLKISTELLLNSGAGEILTDELRLGTATIDDDEKNHPTEEKKKGYERLRENLLSFINAELPLAILVDEPVENQERPQYLLVKVDERGHVYRAHDVLLFEVDNDGNTIPMVEHITNEMIETVKKLHEMQKELNWSPVLDIGDSFLDED